MKQILTLVGMKYRGTSGRVAKMQSGDAITLQREPDNRFDKHAIKVIDAESVHVGYLKANHDQIELAQMMDDARVRTMPAAFRVTPDRWPQIEVETDNIGKP